MNDMKIIKYHLHILTSLAVILLIFNSFNALSQENNVNNAGTSAVTEADSEAAFVKNHPKVDVVFVIDNSGSMIHNDPQFITRDVVTKYLINLREDFRVGMVVFDKDVRLAEPLNSIDVEEDAEKFLLSLESINYKGQFTNTPAGIERAVYELKTNGREKAGKIIILLTDGIVDTGDKEQDTAGEKWLKDDLTVECNKANIRIFGIAFTEMADFRMIQTLALKTDGEYFRAFDIIDIPAVFQKIDEIISRPPPIPEEVKTLDVKELPPAKPEKIIPPAPVAIPEEAGKEIYSPFPLLLSGIIIIVIVIVFLIYLRSKGDFVQGGPSVAARQEPSFPKDPPKGEAELIDAENVISKTDLSLPLDKQVVKIGRDAGNDIVIPKDSISSLHATIEYRNGYFYLEDQRSTNGTKLNGKKINVSTPMRLKSGDKLHFALYEFRFLMPEMAPYGETVMIKNDTEPDLKT